MLTGDLGVAHVCADAHTDAALSHLQASGELCHHRFFQSYTITGGGGARKPACCCPCWRMHAPQATGWDIYDALHHDAPEEEPDPQSSAAPGAAPGAGAAGAEGDAAAEGAEQASTCL